MRPKDLGHGLLAGRGNSAGANSVTTTRSQRFIGRWSLALTGSIPQRFMGLAIPRKSWPGRYAIGTENVLMFSRNAGWFGMTKARSATRYARNRYAASAKQVCGD